MAHKDRAPAYSQVETLLRVPLLLIFVQSVLSVGHCLPISGLSHIMAHAACLVPGEASLAAPLRGGPRLPCSFPSLIPRRMSILCRQSFVYIDLFLPSICTSLARIGFPRVEIICLPEISRVLGHRGPQMFVERLGLFGLLDINFTWTI